MSTDYLQYLGIGAGTALVLFGVYWIVSTFTAYRRFRDSPKQFWLSVLNRSAGMIDVTVGFNQDGSGVSAGNQSIQGIGYHSNVATRFSVPGCITYVSIIDAQSGRTLVGQGLEPNQRCANHDCVYQNGILSIS